MSEVKTCKSTGDYANDAIDYVYATEVEPLRGRIATLEAENAKLREMVRELVEHNHDPKCELCTKALALLNRKDGAK